MSVRHREENCSYCRAEKQTVAHLCPRCGEEYDEYHAACGSPEIAWTTPEDDPCLYG